MCVRIINYSDNRDNGCLEVELFQHENFVILAVESQIIKLEFNIHNPVP